ncbi:hypothetical protein HY061_01620 [Candidatus Azambacteria bacterium]|nr:hypothetical protein [Candidatus Azambacteria bacterium]
MVQIIGVKELYKNLNTISERSLRGEAFIVVKRSKPLFQLLPYKEVDKKQYTSSDLKKIQFKGPKNLSQKIDAILYGNS